jgi:cilia- and flagella-associated protein 52
MGGGASDEYGAPHPDDDPLQLEHMIGYAGMFRSTVISIPNTDLFVKSIGCLVAIENLNDQFDQKFLRGHDMQISALGVSPRGTYIASGQVGTVSYKGNAAPIFVWDVASQRRITALRGLTQRVNHIEFSTDERFLCAMGEDCLLYVWELATSEVVYGQKLPVPASILKWVEHKQENRRISYELVIGYNNTVYRGDFQYDLGRVQWSLKLVPYTMPPGGSIIRVFTDVEVAADMSSLYVGTTGGEVMVFRRGATVFRACIPVCTQGVSTLMVLPTSGNIVVGGGDGTISILEGSDMGWSLKTKSRIESGVRAMSLKNRGPGSAAAGDGEEFLLGTSSGTVQCGRIRDRDIRCEIIQEGHTAPITALAFDTTAADFSNPSANHFFITGAKSGELRAWDIIDYRCVGVSTISKHGSILVLLFLDSSKVLVGTEDGSIRCMDFPGLEKTHWYIATAHRDGTNSLALAQTKDVRYLVSGGNDSVVRVWKLSNRELLTQHSDHKKAVTTVLVDCQSPNIIHSCGMDGQLVSFDLKTNKRITIHMINSGSLFDMTQRTDPKSEIEIVTCDSTGKILQWDIDVREAVYAIQDPTRKTLRTCAISPSGRYLAFSGDDSYLKIIDILSNEVVSLGQGHSGAVNRLCWTPDERQIISAGSDLCLCVWNFYLGEVGGNHK